jgi:hypothetical protein
LVFKAAGLVTKKIQIKINTVKKLTKTNKKICQWIHSPVPRTVASSFLSGIRSPAPGLGPIEKFIRERKLK